MNSKKLCTGCSACAAVCPKKAIRMRYDEQGFIYPFTDEQRCISCGLCDKVCPINKDKQISSIVNGFACSLKDKNELYESTSGGVFFAAAEYTVRNGGIVYGAAYDPFPQVRHIRADSLNSVERMRKSKYTQSQLGESFCLVKKDLDDGKNVLFSGLPCQIAGLKCFLNKNYEKLITMQLFCSGIISEEVWRYYLDFLKERFSGSPINYISRYKSDGVELDCSEKKTKLGWKNPYIKVTLDNGNSIIIPRNTDSLTVAFAKHLGGRHSCSSCAFKLGSHKQYADISIGDFWGCENNAPNSFEPQGVSAVLTYTDKGNAFLHSLTSAMKIDAVDSVDIYKGNPGACKPCQRNINSDRFLDDILRKSMPFDKLVSKYYNGLIVKTKNKVFYNEPICM